MRNYLAGVSAKHKLHSWVFDPTGTFFQVTKKTLFQGYARTDQSRECRSPIIFTMQSSVQPSSVQDGIYALEKAHMRPTPSLRSFPNVALDETVPMLV